MSPGTVGAPGDPEPDPVLDLALDGLQFGLSPRRGPHEPSHVRSSAERIDDVPPIMVHESSGRVVDGVHRVLAARSLGRTRIRAHLFRGTDAEAAVEAVRLNVTHGQPLTYAERHEAARRLLLSHPQWSDRRLAEVCGLSPKTVGNVRRRTVEVRGFGARRIGRDGRTRPVDTLRSTPPASMREVAAGPGASPATLSGARQPLIPSVSGPQPAGSARACSGDPAFEASADARRFAEWFDRTSIDDLGDDHIDAVPLGRVYLVADECRRRAEAWGDLAAALERRARRITAGATP